MFDDDADDYHVGYGRPPKQHQFKRGNKAAAGRRSKREAEGLSDIILRIAREKVTVSQNGRKVKMTRAELAARKIFEEAQKGGPHGLKASKWIADALPNLPQLPRKTIIEFVRAGNPDKNDPQ